MAADECMTPAPRISFLLPRIASERCLAPVRACEAGWRRRYARREIAPASCSVAPAPTRGCVCATCARRAGAPDVRFDVADHNGGSRRDESAGALSGCAEQRRAPHRVAPRPHPPAPARRCDNVPAVRSPWMWVPAPRVSFAATSDSRDSRSDKARLQPDCRVGHRGPNAGRGIRCGRRSFSTRRPREQERDARRGCPTLRMSVTTECPRRRAGCRVR
jgi:hypothetical protein